MRPTLPLPRDAATRSVEPLVNPVFIADIHLSWRKRPIARRFLAFLSQEALGFNELFILGDLFEFWIGDEALFVAFPVINALKRFTDTGRKLYVMPGNRDVLLGVEFARCTGAALIASPTVVTYQGKRILLAHGDEWCTLDADYQAFRARVRSEAFQRQALSMSLPMRLIWALRARSLSKRHKTQRTAEQMDVVKESFLADAEKEKCDSIVHGHTHKPALYEEGSISRLVLPDWKEETDESPSRYGWAQVNSDGSLKLVVRPL